ncbi:hypothetical protein SAMN05443144_104248 [Fodinibius roseus]|uniref:Uncharacterized protein n=1 Tax=Fodinibius roseus TaxID=1194090 RepID=A0A1M4XY46_9BACT|nr:hypothetical protein [Fodinibius roseus]SHE98266.1 hypothetical protein SAMN05443144_104248 [Fodinibius roseus]
MSGAIVSQKGVCFLIKQHIQFHLKSNVGETALVYPYIPKGFRRQARKALEELELTRDSRDTVA